MPVVFPRKFGPYVLVSPLGVGEMGTVALGLMGARNRERLCVVKQLRPHLVADRQARRAVEREIDIARRLSHGGIAQTFASGEEDGVIYLVQEYIEGWSLRQLLNSCAELNRWPSVALSCHIAREVARALAYLHGTDGGGIIHRDIAPSNIMLSFSGEVKLIDFGIAKSADDSRISVAGRYTYGAPEMRQGHADPRSDLYGLGVVLWSLLAHEADPNPFLRDRRAPSDDVDVTIEAPPAPSHFNQHVPPDLDSVVLRALSFLPDDRFQSAVAFDAAVGSFIPPDIVGDEELRRFFRKHTHPEQRREQTLEAAREAARLLDDPSSRPPAAGEIVLPAPASISSKWFEEPETAVVGRAEFARTEERPWRRLAAAAIAAIVAIGGMVVCLRPPRHVAPAIERPMFDRPTPGTASAGRAALPIVAAKPTTPSAPAAPSDLVSHRHGESSRDRERPAGRAAAELLALAKSALESERPDEAIARAERAVAAGAGAEAHLVIGNARMKQRNCRAAESEFVRASDLDPHDPLARRRVEQARACIVEQAEN